LDRVGIGVLLILTLRSTISRFQCPKSGSKPQNETPL
jgi:hypothetical protein